MAIDTLDALVRAMGVLGVNHLYVKPLAENDNSKQQVYVGKGFDILQHLPSGQIATDAITGTMKAQLDFVWLGDDGSATTAPHAQLILYPGYPEVRLSGFLRGCPSAPSIHLRPIPKAQRRFNNGPDGRFLLLGVNPQRRIVAYLALAGSPLALEMQQRVQRGLQQRIGVFFEVPGVAGIIDPKAELLRLLRIIHCRGDIPSTRMQGTIIIPYAATNAAGYTLEAALGIAPNARAAPDLLGWEVKAYDRSPVTVMTPEPDSGLYVTAGADLFLRRFGRVSNDKWRFTGIHKHGERHATTGLRLDLSGFDPATNAVNDFSGGLRLVNPAGALAAGWSYARLAEHWSRKHGNAAYVPYTKKDPPPRYEYRSPVWLGEGTEFPLFLRAVIGHAVYYDPGISMPQPSGSVKRRSQFRIRPGDLASLYINFSSVPL